MLYFNNNIIFDLLIFTQFNQVNHEGESSVKKNVFLQNNFNRLIDVKELFRTNFELNIHVLRDAILKTSTFFYKKYFTKDVPYKPSRAVELIANLNDPEKTDSSLINYAQFYADLNEKYNFMDFFTYNNIMLRNKSFPEDEQKQINSLSTEEINEIYNNMEQVMVSPLIAKSNVSEATDILSYLSTFEEQNNYLMQQKTHVEGALKKIKADYMQNKGEFTDIEDSGDDDFDAAEKKKKFYDLKDAIYSIYHSSLKVNEKFAKKFKRPIILNSLKLVKFLSVFSFEDTSDFFFYKQTLA